MPRKARPTFNADQLLAEFKVYDRAVDVVSSYHWLFTSVAELADSVDHFERYPRIPVPGKAITPDFTVVFTDGVGLVGEVAHIARREESVDGVCRQLQAYSELTEMPGPPNQHGVQQAIGVYAVDVLFLNPVSTVADAARRVFTERMDDPEHTFSPARKPVLVQFSQDGDAYVFLTWPQGNGTFHRGQRATVYGDIDPFVCRPDQFQHNKVRHGFMNDPVVPLYMAVRLWTSVLPNAFWGDEVTVPLAALVTAVRDQHEGAGKTDDVRRGMQVLVAAGLAKETDLGKEWIVTRRRLRGDKNLAVEIAERVRRGSQPLATPPSRRSRSPQPTEGQETLF